MLSCACIYNGCHVSIQIKVPQSLMVLILAKSESVIMTIFSGSENNVNHSVTTFYY